MASCVRFAKESILQLRPLVPVQDLACRTEPSRWPFRVRMQSALRPETHGKSLARKWCAATLAEPDVGRWQTRPRCLSSLSGTTAPLSALPAEHGSPGMRLRYREARPDQTLG